MVYLMNKPVAFQVVAEALMSLPATERPAFLAELIAHAASRLAATEGRDVGARACYRAGASVIQQYG